MITFIARIAGNGPESQQAYAWLRAGEYAVNCQGTKLPLVELVQQEAATCECHSAPQGW